MEVIVVSSMLPNTVCSAYAFTTEANLVSAQQTIEAVWYAIGNTDAYVILVWDKGLFTNVEVENMYGVFSPSVSGQYPAPAQLFHMHNIEHSAKICMRVASER